MTLGSATDPHRGMSAASSSACIGWVFHILHVFPLQHLPLIQCCWPMIVNAALAACLKICFSNLLQGQTCLPEATRRTVARHIWHVQGTQAESSKVIPADTGWIGDVGDDSQSSSASSSAGSDNSVSPEMQRNTSLLLSRSMSLGGALLGRSSSGKQPSVL